MIKGLGSFTIIKNEIRFIKNHLESWLPHLEQMVFYDGNSTDGTLEVLREYAKNHSKIKLFEDKDPKDLNDDYVKMSNDCMWALDTDLAIFLHPDMFMVMKGNMPDGAIAATTSMRSFAGNPGEQIYEIKGRGEKWKNIYRLRNPNLGAHYFGHYGAQNEDIYFSEITGNAHEFYGQDFAKYPYPIFHSDLVVDHYSDVRPYARRLQRMERCLINQGYSSETAVKIAPRHPRVSLKDGQGFKFVKIDKPEFMEDK